MNFKCIIKLIIKLPWLLGLGKIKFHKSSSKMLTPIVLPGGKNSQAATPDIGTTSFTHSRKYGAMHHYDVAAPRMFPTTQSP